MTLGRCHLSILCFRGTLSLSHLASEDHPCVEDHLCVELHLCEIMCKEQLLSRNVKWFRAGLVFKAHRLCVSLNSRLESNKEEEEEEASEDQPCVEDHLCV